MAQQSETLVGCNSPVSVAAQLASNRHQDPDESAPLYSREGSVGGFQPVETIGSRLGNGNRGVNGSAGFVSPHPKGLAGLVIVSEKLKFLTNYCR